MEKKDFRELSRKKYYATKRLPEIRQELLRLGTESKTLRAALTAGAEGKRAVSLARRQYVYLATRATKLKEERNALRADLVTLNAELSALGAERHKATAKAP
ncbi:hypothetical protein [Reyranella sp.]|uniref:hypothetical protein n=1 Tax=Reyranella sp. TaxID=1929291 RepID=UPI003D0E14F0